MKYEIHIEKNDNNRWEVFYEDCHGVWEVGFFNSQAQAIAAGAGFEKGYEAHQAHFAATI